MDEARGGTSGTSPVGRWLWRGCLVMLVLAACLGLLIWGLIAPSDWVVVRIGPLDKDAADYCILAEDRSGPDALSWYHAKLFAFEAPPMLGNADLGMGGNYDHDGDGYVEADVKWREADRYGVLVRSKDDGWRLWWLAPSDVRRPSVLARLLRRGEASMRIPPAKEAVVPDEALIKRLRRGENP